MGLPSLLAHYSARPMRFTINVITQEGLYQNKANSSLVSTYNCKMDYCPKSAKSKRGQATNRVSIVTNVRGTMHGDMQQQNWKIFTTT